MHWLKKLSPAFLVATAIIFGVFIVGASIAYFVYSRPVSKYQQEEQGRELTQHLSDLESARKVADVYKGTLLQFAPANFTLIYSSDWSPISTSSVTLPIGISILDFALRFKSASCILAYTHVLLPSGVQTSYGFDHGNQSIDMWPGRWSVPQGKIPQDFVFNKAQRYPLPYEVLSINYPRAFADGNFLVFDEKGGVVSNECLDGVRPLMQTVQRFYQTTSLTSTSKGLLYVDKYFNPVNDGETAQRVGALFFIESAGSQKGEARDLFRLPALDNSLVAYQNALYYFNPSNGFIIRLDPFTNKETTIDTKQAPPVDSYANLFFINNRLFYIAAGPCASNIIADWDTCDNDLVEYDLETGNFKRYEIKGMASRSILGYDASVDELYMKWGFADGFDAWGETESYNFTTKKLTKIGKYSISYSRDTEKETVTGKTFSFPDQITGAKCLIVENKTLKPCKDDMISSERYGDGFKYVY